MADLCRPTNYRGPDLGTFAEQGVSVIIPSREDNALLRRAIWSVRETADRPFEVIASPSPQPVAANRNACLERATQDLVAFVDDDVLLPAGWMSGLLAVLAADTSVGAVSAWLTFADGAPQMRWRAPVPGSTWRTTIPGTCFVYSRQRVDDQRFDESYLASQWEDTDWMWAVHRRDLSTVVTPDVRVVHEHVPRPNPSLQANMAYFHDKWGRLPDPAEVATIDRDELEAWQRPPLPGRQQPS